LLALNISPVGASSANISHSYAEDGHIPNGSLVSLDDQRSNYVQASNTSNGQRLLGVAVASNDSLLAVDATAGEVQVATSGTATVLVSNVDGNISVGDQIAVSPFNGVGMKAEAGDYIIGLAQTPFSNNSSGATSQSVTDRNGHNRTIQVGQIRVAIAVGTASNANQLNALQRLGKSLTGHVVSTPRIIISLVVAIVAMVALITLVYASIYGTIISIGRNPLAKFAVFRSLTSVLGMVVATGLIASLTIFLLLH